MTGGLTVYNSFEKLFMDPDFLTRLSSRRAGIDGEDECRRFAILAPLVKTEEGLSLLFEVRSSKLQHQPGEVCFPGGAIEADEGPLDAAIRETSEELLIERDQIEVIGPSDILVLPFNLILHPYIGRLRDYQGSFSRAEVADVFTVPLRWFFHHPPEVYDNLILNVPTDNFPYEKVGHRNGYAWQKGKNPILIYEYQDRVIWGMTARMTASLVKMMRALDPGRFEKMMWENETAVDAGADLGEV